MRSKKMLVIVVVGMMVSLAIVGKAASMGTVFTYQGRLMDANGPADGVYDFQFKLFDANAAGTLQGSTIDINDLDVIDGYFTAEVDFGSDVFNGNARWLEIIVRQGDSIDISDYATLSPRQEVTPTPYALSVRVPLELSSQETGPVITATNIADDDDGIGVYGEATGRSGYGIYGKATGDDSSGVHGEATGEDGTGVLGYASGDASYGVQGSHIDSSTAGRLGGFMYGVWGRHYGSGNYGYIGSENYAGYFDGDTVVTGNVGIGTTDHHQRLHIMDGGIAFTDSVNPIDERLLSFGITGIGSDSRGYKFSWRNDDGSLRNQAMILDRTGDVYFMGGNVGIGTPSPAAKLEVVGDMKMAIEDDITLSLVSGIGNSSKIALGQRFNNESAVIELDNTTGVLRFGRPYEPNSLTIDGFGNVGIGTSSPYSKLSVGGNGDPYISIYGAGSNTGVYGRGTYTGVKGYVGNSSGEDITAVKAEAIRAGLDWANVYGVHSKVTRNGNGNYWSGYFVCSGGLGNYNGLYADTRTGGGIDLAEYILDTFGDTEPGDVLVADPDNNESVVKSAKPFDSSVVGIVSTKPHMVIGIELIMDEETGHRYEDVNATQLVLVGRVPVKVTDENGPIYRGDLLTTSSKPGYAMKWSLLDVNEAKDFQELKTILVENEQRRNAILGKALGQHESGDDKIVALINLQ